MNIEFFTKGVQKTESMDNFLQQTVTDALTHFLKNERDVHVRVSVDEVSHRMQSRKPHFICQIHVKSAASKKFFKVEKDSEDFYDAVLRATRIMRRVLGKKSDRRETLKYHGILPAA
jgi:ribosome-associated translation inhibitor RaiA